MTLKQKTLDAIAYEVQSMSNDELLEETLCLAPGDDYDGCFTDRGAAKFAALKDELVKRLLAINFLYPGYGEA